MTTNTVNSQIINAINQSHTNFLGDDSAQLIKLVYQTTAHCVSLIIHNSYTFRIGHTS
ncbi:MAG: RebB family R body protein [Trichodesmium erythraeum GBRTRLIN201]|nr:RebB family R body protein [Trichodesmium erythraeum GBRTRLIN201]